MDRFLVRFFHNAQDVCDDVPFGQVRLSASDFNSALREACGRVSDRLGPDDVAWVTRLELGKVACVRDIV